MTFLTDLLTQFSRSGLLSLLLAWAVALSAAFVTPSYAVVGKPLLWSSHASQQVTVSALKHRLHRLLSEDASLLQYGISPFQVNAGLLPVLYFKHAVIDTSVTPEPQKPSDSLHWERDFLELWALPTGDQPYTSQQSRLYWPMTQFTVTSHFGRRWGRAHNGVDLSAPIGTRINAAATGLVVFSGFQQGYGRLIVIDHGNGLKTRYAHLSESLVHEGQLIYAKQAIGAVGMTGHTYGPHLHFEVVSKETFRNPMAYLPNGRWFS